MPNGTFVLVDKGAHQVTDPGSVVTYQHADPDLKKQSSAGMGTFYASNQAGTEQKEKIDDAVLTGYTDGGFPFSIIVDGGYGAGDHSHAICRIISNLLPIAIEKLQKKSSWEAQLPNVLESLLKSVDTRVKAFTPEGGRVSFQCSFSVQFTFEDRSGNVQCISMGIGDSLSAIYRARTQRYETMKPAFNIRNGHLEADAIQKILNGEDKLPDAADRLPSDDGRNNIGRLIQGMHYAHTVLEPNDVLVQMTDGVHDLLNADSKVVSVEKKERVVQKQRGSNENNNEKSTYFKTALAPSKGMSTETLLEQCQENRRKQLAEYSAAERTNKPKLDWLNSELALDGHNPRSIENIVDDLIELNTLDDVYTKKTKPREESIEHFRAAIKELESEGNDFERDIKSAVDQINSTIATINAEDASNSLKALDYEESGNNQTKLEFAEKVLGLLSSAEMESSFPEKIICESSQGKDALSSSSGDAKLVSEGTTLKSLKRTVKKCINYFEMQNNLDVELNKTGFAANLRKLIALKNDRDGDQAETKARRAFYDKLTEGAKDQFGENPIISEGETLDWNDPKAVKAFFEDQKRNLQVTYRLGDDFAISEITLGTQAEREALIEKCRGAGLSQAGTAPVSGVDPSPEAGGSDADQAFSINEKTGHVSFDQLDRFFQKHFKALQDATEALNAVEPENVDPSQASDGVAYQQHLDNIDKTAEALRNDAYAPGLYQLAEVIKAANHLRFSGLTQDQKRAGCAVHVGLFHSACETVKTAYAWLKAHKDYMSPELQNTLHVSLAQLATNLKEFYNYFCEKNAWAKIYRAYAEQVDSNEKISASFFSSPNYEAQFEEKSKLHYADKTNEDGVVISDGIVSITEKLQRALPEADGSCNLVKPAAILNGSTKEVAQLAGLPRPRTGSASSA